MDTERAQVGFGWGFWLLWMLASTVGIVAGLVVNLFMFGFQGGGIVGEGSPASWGALLGASIGIAQWLVLRWKVSRSGWWVLASTVGLAVGFAVVVAVGGSEASAGAVGGAALGASVGITQWLVLRRQVSQAGWWVLASIGGLAVSFAGFDMVGAVAGAVAFAVGGAMALLGYGAITGGVMVWLLRQPAANKLNPRQTAE